MTLASFSLSGNTPVDNEMHFVRVPLVPRFGLAACQPHYYFIFWFYVFIAAVNFYDYVMIMNLARARMGRINHIIILSLSFKGERHHL